MKTRIKLLAALAVILSLLAGCGGSSGGGSTGGGETVMPFSVNDRKMKKARDSLYK